MSQLAAGHARERHERRDLDVVRRHGVLATAELRDAVDCHHVGADALDRGAHLVEHARDVLHVRLARGVADDRRAVDRGGGHQRVLRTHHGRLVHEEVDRRCRPAVGRGDDDVACRARRSRRARGRRRGAGPAGGGRSRRRPAAASWRCRSARAAGRRPGSEARIRSARSASTCVLVTLAAFICDGVGVRTLDGRRRGPRAARAGPRCRGSCGTLCSVTSSSVSRAQASSGRAAFLLPAGTTVPDSGTPPSMTNFSIGAAARLPSP